MWEPTLVGFSTFFGGYREEYAPNELVDTVSSILYDTCRF